MKKTILLGIIAAASTGISSAVTLQLTDFFGQTTVANNAGDAVAGLTWGVVVDTAGDGFADYTSAANEAIAEGFFAGSADDYLYLADTQTAAFPAPGSVTQIAFNFTGPVSGGQDYALIWFDGSDASTGLVPGSYYGIETNPALTLPASNGDTVDVAALRGAPVPTADLQIVPEPSSALLVGLAGLVALGRRRRA